MRRFLFVDCLPIGKEKANNGNGAGTAGRLPLLLELL